jgi:hypothetical protein
MYFGVTLLVQFVVGGVCLLIQKQARLAATWLGLMTLLLVVFIYVPIVAADPADIGNALTIWWTHYS